MRVLLLACAGAVVASSVVWIACSSSSNRVAGSGDGGSPSGSDSGGPFTLAVPCADTDDAVYGDPGALPPDKGDIIKCATDPDLTANDLTARLASPRETSNDFAPAVNINYNGKPLTSGAHVYRVLYRTERGDAPGGDASVGSPGYSSALVMIPTTPRASGPLPILVMARSTHGQAAACTPSLEEDAGWIVNSDYEALVLPFVGLGYPVIVPDLAGYANFGAPGNPVSGYAAAADVGKGTLDAARALAKMFPGSFNGKVALVGHSQGGHSALSALSMAGTYGAPDIDVAAVAVFAPLWFSQATWGALLYEASDYPLGGASADPSPTAISIWFHYTNGELLDGPGHGLDPFSASQQSVITHFIDNDCWAAGWNGTGAPDAWDSGTMYPDLQAAGTDALSFFDPFFANAIEKSAAFGTTSRPCGDDDAGLLCQKWMARYAADRPHLSNTPPILISYGGADTTLIPPLMQCVTQRLQQDNAGYSFCLDPIYGHGGNLRAHADYAADWIGAQTLGEAPPAACAVTDKNLTTDGGVNGVPIACETPPPND